MYFLPCLLKEVNKIACVSVLGNVNPNNTNTLFFPLRPTSTSFTAVCALTQGLARHRHTINGNSLVVQWLGLRASTAGGMGSIPGQGTKIPGWGTKIMHAVWHGQKKKKILILN